MAHFAELDGNNIVLRVIVVDTRNTSTPDGVEKESIGEAFCERLLGGTWKKTSYNTVGGVHTDGGTPLRGNYAGVGYTYDTTHDVFYAPKPYSSWVLNQTTWTWESPVPQPADGKFYAWDEATVSWVAVPDQPSLTTTQV
jgi:hypothetical protein